MTLTDMPLHEKHSMFLLHMIGRIQIRLRRKLPRLPLILLKGRHLQSLRHRIISLIKETFLQKNQPWELLFAEAKERMTQTPPLLSRLIQGYLDHTGIEACPYHQMDHGVRDPDCDHCKRALGPLYHHKIVGNRHLPVFTFDFSVPHPRRVNMAQ